jgi:hypothetical protein
MNAIAATYLCVRPPKRGLVPAVSQLCCSFAQPDCCFTSVASLSFDIRTGAF